MPASALIALVIGSLVYVADRDWSSAQFLAPIADLQPAPLGVFGPLGLVLPSFLHAYAFALLLIIAIGHTRRARILGAIGWFACAATLEFLQARPLQDLLGQSGPAAVVPPLLQGFQSYVVNGRFDPGDLIATGLGCAAAYAIASVREAPP